MSRWILFTGLLLAGGNLAECSAMHGSPKPGAKANAKKGEGTPKVAPQPPATPPQAVMRRFAELEKLEQGERQIFHALQGHKAPRVLYDLAGIRFKIANFKRDHQLCSPDEYRRYLFTKVVPPLHLNLRAWVKTEPEGQIWMGRSFLLVDEVMACAKRTLKNIPDGKKGDNVGKATYYGGEDELDETHNGPTSLGDTFCMFGQTAAYNRAPLGSWIRVRNPRNGRWIDLRVNDTGPFERKGRLIDLSRGAYAYLRMKNNEKVIVRPIKQNEAIFEPVLCDGKGKFNAKLHLERSHSGLPSAWRVAHLD